MIQKLRQILLTQYIGAIVIAIVAAHCVQTFTILALSILWHLVIVWRTPAGLFGESQSSAFDWFATVHSFVDFLLNGAVVCGLMRWLYFGHDAGAVPEGPTAEPTAPQIAAQRS